MIDRERVWQLLLTVAELFGNSSNEINFLHLAYEVFSQSI